MLFQKKKNHNNLTVPFEKSKTVSFASSIMKNICVFPFRSKFTVKFICCIAFGSVSDFCCVNLLQLAYNFL